MDFGFRELRLGAGALATLATVTMAAGAGAQDKAPETTGNKAAAQSQTATAPSADTVLAVVNGKPITLGHVAMLRSRLPAQYQQIPDAELYEAILEQLIRQQALADLADPAKDKRLAVSLENETRAVLAQHMIEKVADEPISEEEIRAAYEKMKAVLPQETEYNASHILVKTKEEAEEIIRELANGADFATLAKEKSVGPSGKRGGELGWFGEGAMVKPFEEGVKKLEIGQFTREPVQTQFGWHVIRLNDKRLKPPPSLEELRPQIVEELQRRRIEKAVQEALAKAEVERKQVKIDPKFISDPAIWGN